VSYDTKCEELARSFLGDAPKHTSKDTEVLAQTIQDTIEQWLAERFEPHMHTCQQCDKVVIDDCICDRGPYMIWCSALCRAAYDL